VGGISKNVEYLCCKSGKSAAGSEEETQGPQTEEKTISTLPRLLTPKKLTFCPL